MVNDPTTRKVTPKIFFTEFYQNRYLETFLTDPIWPDSGHIWRILCWEENEYAQMRKENINEIRVFTHFFHYVQETIENKNLSYMV